MRELLHLVRNDFRRLFKTPSVPLLYLAFPLALSAIEYGAFGQIGKSTTGLPRGTLLFVDRDRTTVSGMLASAMQQENMSEFFETVKVDSLELAEKRLRDNKGSAALVVPAGFQDSVLAGHPIELTFVPNPREFIRPQMVDAALRIFLDIGNRFLHEAQTALSLIRVQQDVPGKPSRESVLSIAASFFDASQRFEKLGALGDLDVATQRPAAKPGDPVRRGGAPNFFAYFLPGLLLFSVLMLGQGFEGRYFHARLRGLQRRIAASPVRRGTVLLGEAVGILIGTLVSGALILMLGAVLFHIPIRQPAVVALVLLGFGVYVVGVMKTVFAPARTKRAADTVASVVVLLTTLLGGGFVPVEVYSEAVRPIAAATPVGCASQAIVDALVHGRGLAATAPLVIGTWAWGLGLAAIGFALAWRTHARS